MNVECFVKIIDADFYTGVPDSRLKPLCNYLMNIYGIHPQHHIIAANEGNCTALAAGYHLATGKIPVVYMQNSGEGNIINPAASLLSDKVYGIPCIFVIGWRGEPGVPDEPQHICQGEVTLQLLDVMDIGWFIVSGDTTEEEFSKGMDGLRKLLAKGKSVAVIIRAGALRYDERVLYSNGNHMCREEVIRHMVRITGVDPIISTTGKTSRELFEVREAGGQSHKYDFMTIGSMGHSSSIALGVALHKQKTKIWCLDGDGAVLMHMGSMAVIGSVRPKNLVHVVINNGAHETVGGMPTVMGKTDLTGMAVACGYEHVESVTDYEALDKALYCAKEKRQLSFIEAKCSIVSREDLGRPTTSAVYNKEIFMDYMQRLDS